MNSTGTQSASPSLVPGSRRGKPGRPRKGDHGIFVGASISTSAHAHGDKSGDTVTNHRSSSDRKDGSSVSLTVAPIAPRLLDLNSAAQYLGVSTWTVRELSDNGILPRVRIPLPKAGELRKLLFDRQELDELVNRWKERG